MAEEAPNALAAELLAFLDGNGAEVRAVKADQDG
jgi:hypothetical protein